MHTISWVSGIVLALVFVTLATGNALAVASYLRHRRHVPAIPPFGGISGVLACLLLPAEGLRAFWWAPLVVDYGSVPLFVGFFVMRIRAAVRGDHGG